MPKKRPPTREEVKAEYQKARKALADLERKLMKQIREINKLGPNKTEADKKRRDDLTAALKKCRSQAIRLARMTIRMLDDTAEVRKLGTKLESVAKNLKASLKRVNRIKEVAATSGKAIAALEKAAKMAAAYMA